MPRGVPNAKKDETGLRFTTFNVPLSLVLPRLSSLELPLMFGKRESKTCQFNLLEVRNTNTLVEKRVQEATRGQ